MPAQPAYRRIRDDLRAMVQSGELAPGALLPSETTLAERYGVTRMTARQAISELVRENVVGRRQGLGTFAMRPQPLNRRLGHLTSFTDDMRQQGCEVLTRIVRQEAELPTADIRAQLALPEGAYVVHLARLRSIDGRPISLQNSWVPYGRCPSLAREPLEAGSLYKTLETHGVTLRRAEQQISAVSAGAEQARLLEVKQGSPLLAIVRRTFDENNVPVEYAHSFTNPEFPLSIELER